MQKLTSTKKLNFINIFILFFVFLFSSCLAEPSLCQCYIYGDPICEIRNLIIYYTVNNENKYLYKLPPSTKQWAYKYHQDFKSLYSVSPDPNSDRYPDVHRNILCLDRRIDIMGNFWSELYYHTGMNSGPGYSQSEKEEKIAAHMADLQGRIHFCKDFLQTSSIRITNLYIDLFENCIKKNHHCLATYHDYGMLAYLNNNFEKSMELLSMLMDQADATGKLDQLDSEVYHDLGSVCMEVMSYDKAIEYLSESIKQDPNNKSAYFDRALAYFETGDFELAIQDYLISDKKISISVSDAPIPPEFTQALLNGLAHGAHEAAIDFVPSLCNSVYGLSQTLWTTAQHPLQSTECFVSACYNMGECFVDYCKQVDNTTLNGYVSQLKELFKKYDQLSQEEKGKLIGHTIGKYGVDIFAGGATLKMISMHRNIKIANRICNLEAMALSKTDKKAIIRLALKHASERETYLKKITIHWGKQNKHIPGSHNFEIGKGIITLERNELEYIIKKYVGTGQRITGEVGTSVYKERIDFGKVIGKYALESTGQPTQYLSTTKGIITHAKNGEVHLWPSDPGAIIK
ncbi:MAG: hypothetical protein H0T62_00735 [Parachlamydiaceae bacterium]|nr:hypothetical protein [Parachlamydiaceae bacterium]